jgi:hypothetical protein
LDLILLALEGGWMSAEESPMGKLLVVDDVPVPTVVTEPVKISVYVILWFVS